MVSLNVIVHEIDHSEEARVKDECYWEVGSSILFRCLRWAKSDVKLMDVVLEVERRLGRLIFSDLEEFQHLVVATEIVWLE